MGEHHGCQFRDGPGAALCGAEPTTQVTIRVGGWDHERRVFTRPETHSVRVCAQHLDLVTGRAQFEFEVDLR